MNFKDQMKLTIVFSMILFLSLGCKKVLKNPQDYYPEVEMVEATVQEDGSVLVHGRIISPGKYKGSQIENIGFCLNKEGDPAISENQIEGTFVDDLNFYAVYPQFYINDNATNYFRAFATNNFGYGMSEVKAIDSLFLNIDPPCAINEMYYNSLGITGYYDYVQIDEMDNEYIATHGNRYFSVKFPSAIRAGIFKTSPNLNGANNVVCHVNNSTSFVVPEGQDVYVEKTGPTSYRVTVCTLDVMYGQSMFNYKGSFNIEL